MPHPPNGRHLPVIGAVLAAVTIIVFHNVTHYGFLTWDDQRNIYQNPFFSPINGTHLAHLWAKPYYELYTPLMFTIWAGLGLIHPLNPPKSAPDIGPYSLDPHIYHTANLLFHAANALIVFAILRLLLSATDRGVGLRRDMAAAAGALLFAIHPVQVEPVSWITGMNNTASGFFTLCALWFYLKHVLETKGNDVTPGRSTGSKDTKPVRFTAWYGTAIVLFAAALLTKPTSVVAPIIAFVLEVWLLRRPIRAATVALAPWIVLVLACAVMAQHAQHKLVPGESTELWERPLIAGNAIAFYLWKLILPIQLGVDYGRPAHVVSHDQWSVVTTLVTIAIAGGIWALRKRVPILPIVAAVFVAGILPVIGIVPYYYHNISTVADRYLYLALLGPALGLAWLLSGTEARLVTVVCGVVLALLAVRSAFQVLYWRGNIALFAHAIEVTPNSWRSMNNLGAALDAYGQTARAKDLFEHELELHPHFDEGHKNYGLLLKKTGHINEAITQFQEAIQVNPEYPDAHFSLGRIWAAQGKTDDAISEFELAVQYRPSFADAHNELGIQLDKRGDTDGSIAQYQEAIQYKPNYPEAWNNLGIEYAEVGRTDDARNAYQQALRLNPNYDFAQRNLALLSNPEYPAVAKFSEGMILVQRGRYDEAEARFNEALRIDPNNVNAHGGLAIALYDLHHTDEAVAQLREVLRLDPHNQNAQRNLDAILRSESSHKK